MFAVVVTLRIIPEKYSSFIPLMLSNASASRDEPGCRQFDVCTDAEKTNEVFLYELYDNAEAFDLHLKSPHFREFDTATRDMVADKAVQTYGSVAQ